MKKSGLVNSLSALILLAFGVIWLVYLCAGNAMSEPVQNGLSLTVSLLALLTYMLKAICNSRNMPVWLVWIIVIAIIGAVPANIVELLETCNIDISHINPILDQVISISHGITFIILYLLLMYNAFGVTESWIFRLIFLVIGIFLIFCVVADWVPVLQTIMPVPLIGFN